MHPDIPDIYASVSNQTIKDQIGYIRFDVFHPAILDTVLQVINSYQNLPNLILDIRGNPGGAFKTRKTLAEQFISERTLFWKYRRRNETEEIYLDPPSHPYLGKLVVLVDALSGSSSEEFAGGLQAIGRAIIIGRRTPGKVLTMDVITLPGGAFFIYPNAQTLTANGRALEGYGVIPDISVKLDRSALISGTDSQLSAAVEFLLNN